MSPPPMPCSTEPVTATRQPRWTAIALAAALVVAMVLAAIPNFDGQLRPNAQESAAFATLKLIARVQSQVHAMAAIDCDQDHRGEYATFAELAGAVPLRSRNGSSAGDVLVPAVLSPSFGKLQHGCVHRSGYVFQMFLPGSNGVWLPESPGGGALAGIDPGRASRDWICYAWPLHPREGGRRVFVIDSQGHVLATSQGRDGYLGTRGPRAGVAAHAVVDGSWALAVNTVDVLGDIWVTVN